MPGLVGPQRDDNTFFKFQDVDYEKSEVHDDKEGVQGHEGEK